MMRAALVAGETSGDLLAAVLLDGLRERWPDLLSFGIGGPQMVARGFTPWWRHDKLSVHGFGWEVLRRYAEIVAIRRQLRSRLLRHQPDVFIGVDAPDFNLDLAYSLKQQGIRTLQFVCPSVWAWRAERLEKIKRSVDRVLCLFPFEPELLARHGIAASYVGHPLAQLIALQPDQSAARKQLGLADSDLVLALLPGSRESEVKHLALCFFQAAGLLRKKFPALQLVVPVLPLLKPLLHAAARASGLAEQIRLVDGQSHAVLGACDVCLIASGTATLEAALFKKPMVIAYRMGALSWRIMRAKRLQPWVGLPNILCRHFVVPELLQEAASAPALARALEPWLDTGAAQAQKKRQLEERFLALHQSLLRATSSLAADAIAQTLQN